MKLFFKYFLYVFLFLIWSISSSLAKEFEEVYLIEFGGIDIGKSFWKIKIEDNKYRISIKLKDKGFFSGLYSFNGVYEATGIIEGKNIVSQKYKQLWETKRKKREVLINFNKGALKKLDLKPEEKSPRINYLEIKDHLDPLSSFLKILISKQSSKTVDGRRVYLMQTSEEKHGDNKETIKVSIKNFQNIWADHKRNNFKYIEIKRKESNDFLNMPEVIKIKLTGFLFKLSKI